MFKVLNGNIRSELLNLTLPNADKFNQMNSIDGFYKILRSGDISRGYLYYDKDCLNHLKLAVKLLKSDESRK